MADDDKVRVTSVNAPTYSRRLDGTKLRAMTEVLRAVLPTAPPGLTQSEMVAACKAAAPQDLFPGGEKVGWWMKSVQLDLEAKGEVVRDGKKPLRWWRIASS